MHALTYTCANCCFSRLKEGTEAATAAGSVSGFLVKVPESLDCGGAPTSKIWFKLVVVFPPLLLAVSDAGSTAPDSDALYSRSKHHTHHGNTSYAHTPFLPGLLAVT